MTSILRLVCTRGRSFLAVLFLLAFAPLGSGQDTPGLEQLREIQSRIQKVAAQNTLATVLVTDGIGSGSGVIVSADGLVLTAGHVLTTGGNDYRVTLPTGREVKAHALGKNLNFDAGMVQMDAPGPWPYVELGKYDSIRVGDWAVCLGHPGGYEIGRTPPVRAGKIIAVRPSRLITDCALIGGDSGGPLFDLDGKLIGIHSSISDSISMNRHVSINIYQEHWDRMKRGESWGVLPELTDDDSEEEVDPTPRAGLGITVDINARQAKVTVVRPGSIAEQIGVHVGDIVVRINDAAIHSPQQVIDLIAAKSPGDSIDVTVERNGQQMLFSAKLDAI